MDWEGTSRYNAVLANRVVIDIAKKYRLDVFQKLERDYLDRCLYYSNQLNSNTKNKRINAPLISFIKYLRNNSHSVLSNRMIPIKTKLFYYLILLRRMTIKTDG